MSTICMENLTFRAISARLLKTGARDGPPNPRRDVRGLFREWLEPFRHQHRAGAEFDAFDETLQAGAGWERFRRHEMMRGW